LIYWNTRIDPLISNFEFSIINQNQPALKKFKFFFTILYLLPLFAFSQVQKVKSSDKGIGYLEYIPESYNSSGEAHPCIIFLHGSGERGNGTSDINKVKKNGPPKLIENGHKMCFEVDGKTECFVVISPQTHRWAWQPFEYIPFTDYIIKNYNVDPNRIYLTGLSMGGSGVWMNAYDDLNNPSRFAAIAPIAGYADEKKACTISKRNLPVWAFHGMSDNAVNPWGQIKMIDAIKACNPKKEVILTLYDGVGHNSWSRAYNTGNKYHSPNLYEWFLKKRKNDDPIVNIIAPSNLNLTNNTLNSLTIEWQDNSNNELNFVIEVKTEKDLNYTKIAEISSDITKYTLIDLTCNTGYSIRVKATNSNSESAYTNTINSSTLYLDPPNIVAEGDLSFCEGNSVKLAVSNGDFDKYQWNNGKNGEELIVTESGEYSIKGFKNNCWSKSSDHIKIKTIELPPKPIITGNNNFELCNYKPVTLSIQDEWDAYEWSNGATTEKIEVNTPGQFAAKIKQNGCWGEFSDLTKVKNAEIPAKPIITYDPTVEICEGLEVTLSTDKNYSYYEWSTGEKTSSIKIKNSGSIYVKAGHCQDLMSENSKVVDFNFKKLTEKPAIQNSSGETDICPGQSISLSAPADFEKYLWSTNQSTKTIEISHSENITLKVKEKDKCWSSTSNPIKIDLSPVPAKPVVDYNGSLSLCGNNVITLSTKQAHAQYLWSDNSSVRQKQVNNPGIYKVKVKNNNCWSEYSDPVTIKNSIAPPKPVISFNQNKDICFGDKITLSAPDGWQYYRWNTGETTKNIIVEKTGNYTVKVGDCKDIWSNASDKIELKFLPISPTPAISVIGKTELCPGDHTEIVSSSSYDNYYWSNNEKTKKITTKQANTYSLKVKNNGYCVSLPSEDIIITEASVPAKPVIEHDGELVLCDNESITLSINDNYSQYFWTNNQTTSSIVVQQPGNFSAKVKNSEGCWSDYSNIISIVEKSAPSRPVISYNGSVEFCDGDSLILSVKQEYSHYLWNNNQTSSSITVKDSGSYAVQVAYCKDQWSSFSQQINVNVASKPENITIYESGDSLLTVKNENYLYQWYFDGNPLLGATNHFIVPYNKGDYNVKVSNEVGCYSFSERVSLVNKSESMVLFKNPTETGHFKIKVINKKIKKGQIEVLSFNSRVVLQFTFDKLADGIVPYDFNLEGNKRGMYVIRMISNNVVYSKTLVYR